MATPFHVDETMTADQLLDALVGVDATAPVYIEVLGELIDIESVTVHEGVIRIIGAEFSTGARLPGVEVVDRTCSTKHCLRHLTLDARDRWRPEAVEMRCSGCGLNRPVELFAENLRVRRGRNSHCIDCSRASARRHRGVHPDDADARPPEGQRCEICSDDNNGRAMFLDHDHSTGRFRGWLCNRCNTAIGMFDDDPERLAAAVVYLERRPSP